jgi:hypothetical protein
MPLSPSLVVKSVLLAAAMAVSMTSPAAAAGPDKTRGNPYVPLLRDYLLRTRRPAVMLLREHPRPGDGARSWFGGLPSMPADLPWPVRASTGQPMSFVAQIDLSELPPTARAQGLPADGVLWFFVAVDDTIEDEGQVAALYRPPGAALIERPAPDALPLLQVGGPYEFLDPADPWTRVDVREPIVFRAVDSFLEYGYDAPGFDKDFGDPRGDVMNEVLDALQTTAVRRALGATADAPAPPSDSTERRPAIDTETWPQTGIFAELGAGAVLHLLSRQDQPRTTEGLAAREALVNELKAQRARWAASPFQPLMAEERLAFRAWVRAIGTRIDELIKAQTGRSPYMIANLEREIDGTLPFAAYQVLAHGGPGVAALPPAYRQPAVHPPVFLLRDQMLGYGSSDQDGPYHNRDKVLLLQVAGGEPAFWVGEGMMLHFWITPQDLAARRFDRVTTTYEGD